MEKSKLTKIEKSAILEYELTEYAVSVVLRSGGADFLERLIRTYAQSLDL
jgi:hypothetical protein